MSKPSFPLCLMMFNMPSQEHPPEYLNISDIDQIGFSDPMAASKKLITSLMYVMNK